jgi:hypothetical protein
MPKRRFRSRRSAAGGTAKMAAPFRYAVDPPEKTEDVRLSGFGEMGVAGVGSTRCPVRDRRKARDAKKGQPFANSFA